MIRFGTDTGGHSPSQPRFSGYRVGPSGVNFYLPGRVPRKDVSKHRAVVLEYHLEGEGSKQIEMRWNAAQRQWATPRGERIPNEKAIQYRFLVDPQKIDLWDQPSADQPYAVLDHTRTAGRPGDVYNVIPARSDDPCSNGTVVLNFPDSLVVEEELYKQIQRQEAGDTLWPYRNHFKSFGGDDRANPILVRLLNRLGVRGVEERPIIGGDRLSSHGYWTTSMFQPSSKIASEKSFQEMALSRLQQGGKWFFDGAFVNEGLNGVHFLSNLMFKDNSPFLDWFDYGKLNQFPHQPLEMGILPVKTDPFTQQDVLNDAAWDIRFVPPTNRKQEDAIWFVQLYDPRLEDAKGNRRTDPSVKFIPDSQSSVVNYSFPISAKEARAKLEQLHLANAIRDPEERAITKKRLKREWDHFHLTMSVLDASGYKWDGQRDVAKIKVSRPDVQQYLADACGYWTDKVDRIYTRSVADALVHSKQWNKGHQAPRDILRAVEEITQKQLDGSGLLPALNRGQENPLTVHSIEKAVEAHRREVLQRGATASQNLIKEIQTNFHPGTLPAPSMVQVLFNTPRFVSLLKERETPVWLDFLGKIFHPFIKLIQKLTPSFDPVQWLKPKPFYQLLEDRVEAAFKQDLSQSAQDKLKDPILGHLFYEEVARSIFLSLLTNKSMAPEKEVSQAALAQMYDRSLEDYITGDCPPEQAAVLLNDHLIEGLNKLNLRPITQYLESKLMPLTAESGAVARHVLHTRKLGLHWRIDALKDLGDMDAVRSAPQPVKTERFRKELDLVQSVMGQIAGQVRNVFPGSIIKPEITDLNELVSETGSDGAQMADTMLQEMMDSRIYNGIPNMKWLFASGFKAVHMAPRPEGEGESQLKVSDFIQGRLKPMMRILNLDQVMQFENLTSSHDYITSIGALTLHADMTRCDHYGWVDLNKADKIGFFEMALNELQYKSQLGLNFALPRECYDRLRGLAHDPEIVNRLSEDVKRYLDRDQFGHPAYRDPVPSEIKGAYIDQLFAQLSPERLGVTDEHFQRIQKAMRLLITEPSETKSLRGKLSNSFQLLRKDPKPLADALGKTPEEAKGLLDEIRYQFDRTALDFVQSFEPRYQRWLGYREVDSFINFVVDRLPECGLTKDPEAKRRFKQVLYNQTIGPALEQFKRVAALQVAMPGDPTFYLPDLLGQAGGEDVKNMYLGCRELIRYDWLETNPVIQKFFDELAPIIRQRYSHHVLNNGHLELPLDPDQPQAAQLLADSTVLPLIRDNGKDQAICLVNFSKPRNAWEAWMGSQNSTFYPELYNLETRDYDQSTVTNYQLSLGWVGVPENTIYESAVEGQPDQKEYFIVNAERRLVKLEDVLSKVPVDRQRGIDVHITRTLNRISYRKQEKILERLSTGQKKVG